MLIHKKDQARNIDLKNADAWISILAHAPHVAD